MRSSELKVAGLPLAITLAIQALVSMAAVTLPVLAPAAAADIGVASTYLGVFVALLFLTAMVSSATSGNLILRYGAIRVSQACLASCALGLAATATASIPMFVVGAVLIGMAYGPLNPASSHILVRTTPPRLMALTFSLKQTGVPLGAAMAGAVVPRLERWSDWSSATLIVAAACAVVALLAQRVRSRLDDDRQPRREFSYGSMSEPLVLLFRSRRLLQLAIASCIFMGIQLCLVTYLVAYLTGELGMTLIAAGLAMSATQAAGIVGRVMWGVVADRFVRPRMLLGLLGIGMSIGAVATSLVQSGWPYGAVIAALAVFGCTAIGWNGVYLAEVARLSPAGTVGAMTGASMSVTYLGVVLGPPAFGAVVSFVGSFSTGYLLVGFIALACAIVLVVSQRMETRSTLEETPA